MTPCPDEYELAPDPAWRTAAVLKLVAALYETGPAVLPVLADALDDAGCPPEVAAHCREPGPHRKCWLNAFLLGLAVAPEVRAPWRAVDKDPNWEPRGNPDEFETVILEYARVGDRPVFSPRNLAAKRFAELPDPGVPFGMTVMDLPRDGLRYFGHFTNLRAIRVLCLKGSDPGLAHLAALPNLEFLDVAGAGVTDAVVAGVSALDRVPKFGAFNTALGEAGFAAVAAMPGLEAARFPECRTLTDSGMAALCAAAGLKSLNILGTGVTDAGLAYLPRLPRLRRLCLAWNTATSDAGLASVGTLADLEKLWLFRAGITDAGLRHLAGLEKLEFLQLSDTAVTDAGLRTLATIPALRELLLRGTKITDAGLPALAALPNLTALDLNYTAVTDAGVARLSAMPTLTDLHLRGPAVTDAGLLKLLALPNLRVLELGTPPDVTPAAIDELRTRWPGIEIAWDPPAPPAPPAPADEDPDFWR